MPLWWILAGVEIQGALHYPWPVWVIPLLITLVGTALPYALCMGALRRLPATRVSIVATLEPVMAGRVTFVLFSESLGPIELVGGTLVILAVLAVQHGESGEVALRERSGQDRSSGV
ncbi:MAG: EamA family transporter [Candidatus Methylomirabilales bacterium]